VWDARVGVDVLDDGRFPVQHRPAADAVLDGKLLALPQRRDRVLFDVVAGAPVTQDHERRPVGAGQLPRTRAHDPLDVGD
jgi:hypothetical protein